MANPRKFSEKIALMNQRQAEGDAAFQAIMREVNESLTTPAPQVNVTRSSGQTQQNATHMSMMGGGPRSHKLSSGDAGGLPLSAMLSAPSANMNMASLGVGGAFPPLNHTASLPNVNQVGAHPNGAHQGPGPMQQGGGYSQYGGPQPNVNSMMQTGFDSNSGGIDLATALSNLENMKSGKQVLANKLHSSRARQLLAPSGAQLGAPIRRPNHVDKRVDASPTGNMQAPFLSPPAAFDALWRRTHSDSAINQSAAGAQPVPQPGGPSQAFLAPSRFDQSPNAAANQQQQAQNQQSSPSHRASTPTAMAAANAGAPSYLHREMAIAKSSSYFAMPNAHAQAHTGMQQLPAFHPASVRSRSCEISPSALRNVLSNGAAQCSPHDANPSGNSNMNGVNERDVAQYGVGLANTQASNCGQFLTAGNPGSGPNWGGAPASTYLSTPNIAYLTSCAGGQPQNANQNPNNQNPNQLCVGVAMGGPSSGPNSGSGGTPMFATHYSQNAASIQHQQPMDGNSSQLLSSSLPNSVPFQPTGSLPDLSFFQQPPRLTPGAGGGGGAGNGGGGGGGQQSQINFQYTPSMMRKPVPAPLVMNSGAQPAGGGLYSPTNMSPVRLPSPSQQFGYQSFSAGSSTNVSPDHTQTCSPTAGAQFVLPMSPPNAATSAPNSAQAAFYRSFQYSPPQAGANANSIMPSHGGGHTPLSATLSAPASPENVQNQPVGGALYRQLKQFHLNSPPMYQPLHSPSPPMFPPGGSPSGPHSGPGSELNLAQQSQMGGQQNVGATPQGDVLDAFMHQPIPDIVLTSVDESLMAAAASSAAQQASPGANQRSNVDGRTSSVTSDARQPGGSSFAMTMLDDETPDVLRMGIDPTIDFDGIQTLGDGSLNDDAFRQ